MRLFDIKHTVHEGVPHVSFGLRGPGRLLLSLSEWTIEEQTTAHLVAEVLLGVLARPLPSKGDRRGRNGNGSTRELVFAGR